MVNAFHHNQQGRIPYPYAAWPESEPRPWESKLNFGSSSLRGALGPKIIIRSDPTMLAVGAQRDRKTAINYPNLNEMDITQPLNARVRNDQSVNLFDRAGNIDASLISNSSEAMRDHRALDERGVLDLILGELEGKCPRKFKGFFDILRGRYSMETRPSVPVSSSLGFLGSVLFNGYLAFLHSSSNYSTLLLLGGIMIGFICRNWFLMNVLACRLFSLMGMFLIVSSGTGVEFLLGTCLGTWISVRLVLKTQATTRKRAPEVVARDTQPMHWVHERWQPGRWEILLHNGWAEFPHDAQEMLERAQQSQEPQVILNMGQFGEHRYHIDLLSNVATNLSSDEKLEMRIRRAPIE